MTQLQSFGQCVMSDMKFGPQDRTLVIDLIKRILNEALLERLGSQEDGTFRTILEVMTVVRSVRNIYYSIQPTDPSTDLLSIDKANSIQIMEIYHLQSAVSDIHKEVGHRVSKKRQLQQHNKLTNIIPTNLRSVVLW